MTNRERLLAIMEGRSPDHIPWIPRLEIWYQAHKLRGDGSPELAAGLPERYREWTLRDIERDLGMGTPARAGRVFRTEMRNVTVHTERHGDDAITEYHTPVGTVSTVHRHSATLARGGIDSDLDISHMIKSVDDYPVVEYIVQHTDVVPTYQEYLEYEAEIGEDGVPLVAIGPDPLYRILRDLVGYNQAFYHLHDYRRDVLHLYAVLTEYAEQVQQVVLDSPARLILHGEHFDTQMTPPALFRTYMLPYFQPFAEKLHARGKVLVCHADADTSRLLDLIMESGFDMAECFVTAPMVPVTLAQARAVWGTRVAIWGGIPSALLSEPFSDADFEAYMRDLFRTIAPGDAFILGVADNVMAEAKFERIARVSEMVAAYGAYPIAQDIFSVDASAP